VAGQPACSYRAPTSSQPRWTVSTCRPVTALGLPGRKDPAATEMSARQWAASTAVHRSSGPARHRAAALTAKLPTISKPLFVKKFRRSFSRRLRCPSGAVALSAILDRWPSSRPSVAVVLPRFQVVRPRSAAGAPPGPSASPTVQSSRGGTCPRLRGGWQRQRRTYDGPSITAIRTGPIGRCSRTRPQDACIPGAT
jgi:hypothetical protein